MKNKMWTNQIQTPIPSVCPPLSRLPVSRHRYQIPNAAVTGNTNLRIRHLGFGICVLSERPGRDSSSDSSSRSSPTPPSGPPLSFLRPAVLSLFHSSFPFKVLHHDGPAAPRPFWTLSSIPCAPTSRWYSSSSSASHKTRYTSRQRSCGRPTQKVTRECREVITSRSRFRFFFFQVNPRLSTEKTNTLVRKFPAGLWQPPITVNLCSLLGYAPFLGSRFGIVCDRSMIVPRSVGPSTVPGRRFDVFPLVSGFPAYRCK